MTAYDCERCSCIPTPQSILDEYERDVFDEIFGEVDYGDVMKVMMWSTYQFRGIGNCNIDYWVQCMYGRFTQIVSKYLPKFKVFDEWYTQVMGVDPVDLSEGATEYTMKNENEDTPDNPQGTSVYLSDRNTTTYNGKTYSGLSSETISRFMDYVPDLTAQFTDEFRQQFYWGL